MNPEKSPFTETFGDFKYDPKPITDISTFSDIYKGRLAEPSNKSWPGIGENPVILKRFQLDSDYRKLTWNSEMAALKHIPSLKQGGLVRSFGSFKDGIEACLVSEYMNMGNLQDLGVKKESFKEQQLKAALWPIVNGLTAMHKKGIIHLDVKPTNIMQTRDPTTKKVKTKLGDFGNVHIITEEHPSPALLGGTTNHLAPEQCRYQLKRMKIITYPTEESKEHDKDDELFSTTGSTKCDVWSLGVTSWWILKHGGGDIFHNRPKTPQSLIELYETIYNTDLEAEVNSINDLSPSGRNWLNRLLIRDPKKRCTMEDAVNDEWFKEMRKSSQPAAAVSTSASHSSTSNHSVHPSSAVKQQPAVTPIVKERSPQGKPVSKTSRLSRAASPTPQKSTLAPAPAPKKPKSVLQTDALAERPKVQTSTRSSITRTPENGPKPSPSHSTRSNPSETTPKVAKPVATKTKPSPTTTTRVSTTSSTSSSRSTKPPVDTVSHQPTKARVAPLSASSRRETPATAAKSTKTTRAAQKSGDGSDSAAKKKQQQKDRSSSPTN